MGITNEEGELDRILPLSGWLTPLSVELKLYEGEEVLVSRERIQPTIEDYRRFRRHANGKMLAEFLMLVDRPSERVLDFARYWGMLKRKQIPANAKGIIEPVRLWRDLARMARTAISLSAWLRTDGPMRAEDTEYLQLRRWTVTDARLQRHSAQKYIAHVVNNWLGEAGVVPFIAYDVIDGQYPEFALRAGSVYAGLAMHLVMAVSASEGFVLCSGCGIPFLPRRRPSAGDDSYCAECRDRGVPQRRASARYRRRKAAT